MGVWPILSGLILLAIMFFIYAATPDNVKSNKCVVQNNSKNEIHSLISHIALFSDLSTFGIRIIFLSSSF